VGGRGEAQHKGKEREQRNEPNVHARIFSKLLEKRSGGGARNLLRKVRGQRTEENTKKRG